MGCVQGNGNSGIPFLAYLDFGNKLNSNSFNVFQISPGPNATGLSLNTSIQVGFNQKLDPSSIQSQSMQLTQGNSVITGSLTSTEKTLLFNPTSSLAASKVYTVRVSKAIKSEDGSSLSEDYVWNFTTGAVVDAIAPDLSLRTPAANAALVPNNTSVQVALTETIDCTSVNGGTLSLKNTATTLYEAGNVACVGSVITFTPTIPLTFNTTYRVDLFSTAKDLANNTLANNYNWNFTTGPGPDNIPPTVSFISPAPNSLNIPINSAVSIAFSEPVDCTTVNGNIVLDDPSPGTINVGVNCTGTTVTLTPLANLATNAVHTVTFSNAIKDLQNNGLTVPAAPSTFTTAAAPIVDNTPPTVTSQVPAASAIGAGLNTKPMVVFSEPMDCSTVNTASFKLKETGSGTYLSGTVQCFGTSATWTPDPINPFTANKQYTVEVTAGALDAAMPANALNPPVIGPMNLWNFTTGPGPDVVAPNVVLVTPSNGALGVPVNSGGSIAFSEAMNCASVGAGSILLDDQSNFSSPIVGVTITCNGNTATFTPPANLAFNQTYYARVKSAVTDTTLVNSMGADYDWSFTTGAAADSTVPQISLSSPSSGATGIPTNATITVAFSETIDCTTLNLTVNNLIAGTTTCSGSSATFVPNAGTPLNASTTYAVTIAAGLKDIAGNAMAGSNWNFTTGAAPDVTPPAVAIQNLRAGLTTGGAGDTGTEGSIVESGFVIGTAADARGIATIEVNIDNTGWTGAGVSGTTSWKYPLPTGGNTWRLGSSHTIQVRATDTSNNVTTSGTITVKKGTNKDINGDGYVDLVASEYGQGLVYLFYSSGTGGITATDPSAASRTIVGVKTDFFGKSIASGDFNGDGFADIAVGAPKSNTDGKVFIFHSAGTQGINTSFYAFANTILVGDGASEQFGASLATGDINGDIYTDLVVGAPAYNASRGRIYLFYSQGGAGIATADAVTDGTNTCLSGCTYIRGGITAGDKFGFSIAVGNINGGNYDDIAVGAPGYTVGGYANNGRVYVYYGDGSVFTTTGPHTIDNNATNVPPGSGYPNGIYSQFGYSVAVADFTEDNYADLVVGAPEYAPNATGNDQKGKICIFVSSTATGIGNISGMANATRYITGDNAGDQIGRAITARDLDLDGRADLITSTHTAVTGLVAGNWNNSAVFLTPRNGTIGGVPLLSNKSYGITGIGGYVNITNGPGNPLSTGDVNGDGIPDLIIGRPTTQTGVGSNRISIFHLPEGTGQPADLATPTFNIVGSLLTGGIGGSISSSNEFGAAFY
ncbi:Ig-like domain-containing protein [Leptospira weilii]|uniref:Ig-like domain-containing protein n=1 Tax=Leptospira weilii TaxID=28184 RepID=UPI0007746A0F|nr:Ig-like domain-containing protein [Leptospira weilii]